MNKEYTIQELTEKVKAFCEERDWDQFHNPKDLAIGISTEANELLDLFRFKNEQDMQLIFSNAEKRKKVEDEVADVFFFLLRFAQMNHLDLKQALDRKISKNAEKYPVQLAKGRNDKYSDL